MIPEPRRELWVCDLCPGREARWRPDIGKWLCDACDPAYRASLARARQPIPARGWLTLAVIVVCMPAIAAGVWVADRIRAAADRSAIPARWRLPLLAGAMLALAGLAGLAFRWAMGV